MFPVIHTVASTSVNAVHQPTTRRLCSVIRSKEQAYYSIRFRWDYHNFCMTSISFHLHFFTAVFHFTRLGFSLLCSAVFVKFAHLLVLRLWKEAQQRKKVSFAACRSRLVAVSIIKIQKLYIIKFNSYKSGAHITMTSFFSSWLKNIINK